MYNKHLNYIYRVQCSVQVLHDKCFLQIKQLKKKDNEWPGKSKVKKPDFVNKNNRLNQLWDSRGKIVRAPDYVTLFHSYCIKEKPAVKLALF